MSIYSADELLLFPSSPTCTRLDPIEWCAPANSNIEHVVIEVLFNNAQAGALDVIIKDKTSGSVLKKSTLNSVYEINV